MVNPKEAYKASINEIDEMIKDSDIEVDNFFICLTVKNKDGKYYTASTGYTVDIMVLIEDVKNAMLSMVNKPKEDKDLH